MWPGIEKVMNSELRTWGWRSFVMCCCMSLFACGGGGGGASGSAPASTVNLSGKVTYDFISHTSAGAALDYTNITVKAGRGLVVEILDGSGTVLASTVTDNEGNYSVAVARDKSVKVRVKAQLQRTQSPTWNFKVTDNTQNNALYVMDGSLVAATDATAVRNLHAASGWTGDSYAQTRVAAPFAILDSVLLAVERINAAGNSSNFPALELRWSTNNTTASGNLALGEIGTSYFTGEQVYILGDDDTDTDEYDRSVILHEFGHYIEAAFSRSDSLGGDHGDGDKLDMRVAMSEGFANAFSGMISNDEKYSDTSGGKQADGFVLDISDTNAANPGWYSEQSVGSVFYNFYTSSEGKTARDFEPVFKVITADNYVNSPAMASIYLFADQLRSQYPDYKTTLDNLLTAQSIYVADTNAYGAGETNDGGYAGSLPVYKVLNTDNSPVNVCSTNEFGAENKLAVAQLMRLEITTAGTYTITVQEAAPDSGDSDPDIYIYRKGVLVGIGESTSIDTETKAMSLNPGIYIVEVSDARMWEPKVSTLNACFNVTAH